MKILRGVSNSLKLTKRLMSQERALSAKLFQLNADLTKQVNGFFFPGFSDDIFLMTYTLIQSLAVIKKIDIAKMSEEERKETFREAKILEVLNHPNIIRFKEVYKTKRGQLCIVMDYADGKLKD